MQRICRYPLLFKELAKNSIHSKSQYEKVSKVVKIFEGIIFQINESKRMKERIQRVVQIESNLIDIPEVRTKNFSNIIILKEENSN